MSTESSKIFEICWKRYLVSTPWPCGCSIISKVKITEFFFNYFFTPQAPLLGPRYRLKQFLKKVDFSLWVQLPASNWTFSGFWSTVRSQLNRRPWRLQQHYCKQVTQQLIKTFFGLIWDCFRIYWYVHLWKIS